MHFKRSFLQAAYLTETNRFKQQFWISSMNKRFHIIITGESGKTFGLQLSKRKCLLSLLAVVVTLVSFCTFSYFTTGSYFNSKRLSSKVEKLSIKLKDSEEENAANHEQITSLKERHRNELAALIQNHTELFDSQREEFETQLADQKIKFDLETTSLQLENVRLMNTAVSDLNQRSELIDTIMATIGVKIKKSASAKSGQNSGGPFVADTETSYDELLNQVDEYLKTMKALPLGKPVHGRVSSGFGKRVDPVNKKKAIHEGVDIKGKRGAKIVTTGSGKVIKAFKNAGYGNYVEIDHGNGYVTAYAHLQNYLVRRGERVEQGQVIGQLGSSGRSTGPHLHYEIRLNKKPINPDKFMKVADISHTLRATQDN